MTKLNYSMAISAPAKIAPPLLSEINEWGWAHYGRTLLCSVQDVHINIPIWQIVVRFDTEKELSLFCLQFKRSYE
jgi:hypothetical protein